ncbi:MAG: hypothetical protein JF888_07690 [Candidatus Dormibacteraeota bacterium]|uniref:Uncharacterized protein n=1 Tax=Candidatus Dormiibacter inghamiae TaxID=3127013 RepID=A0A934KE12_9BACT|nr:hypothetical protein [Candidatus Dormibacteraeota bacterium]MBJ7606011.1 hypothetical protein [Candidatus Dormibacteraeota bacterium]
MRSPDFFSTRLLTFPRWSAPADQRLAGEDALDGGDCRGLGDERKQMVADGPGAGVIAGCEQSFTETEDGGLRLDVNLVRAGPRPPGTGSEGVIATFTKRARSW